MNLNAQPQSANNSSNKFMFRNAMKGDWEAVVTAYGDLDKEGQKASITKSGDTVLHVAISSGKRGYVERLVNLIKDVEVLQVTNERKNTPLHLASLLGFVDMCRNIMKKEEVLSKEKSMSPPVGDDKGLIAARNTNGETPFFLAALRGRSDVFFYLAGQVQVDQNHAMQLCRRNDGDTILHCSIGSEFFDIAFWIVNKFPMLANAVNQKGLSPLQILAKHPSAFKSGSRLKRTDNLIYACTWVDPLESSSLERCIKKEQNLNWHPNIPQNYETCFRIADIFKSFLKHFFLNLKNWTSKESKTSQPLQQIVTSGVDIIEISGSSTPNGVGQDIARSQVKEGDGGNDIQKLYYPKNYKTLVYIIKCLAKIPLIPLGLEFGRFQRIRVQKEKHIWAAQVMGELIKNASSYEYDNTGMSPNDKREKPHDIGSESPPQEDQASSHEAKPRNEETNKKPTEGAKETSTLAAAGMEIANMIKDILAGFAKHPNEENNKKSLDGAKETAILTAARMGIVEMVEGILETFPVAIQDMDQNNKNAVLLAVENRQPQVYQYLLKIKVMNETVFQEVDDQGNSALHLAATMGHNRPWLIPGAALQMQWEIKWFKYVEDSMPINFFGGFNNEGKTPKEVFSDTHKALVDEAGKWLTNTSQSCSVVAALIATVAFATATTVPGGIDDKTGFPILETEPPFKAFAISSLVALCFSVTSLVMFLSILTSRYEEKDFAKDLPLKLISGLTSLYVSLAAMLVSFCAGHFFVLREKLKYAAFPIYAVTCLPITFFALAQFPLYVDLVRCTLRKVPLRTYKMLSF